MIHGKKIKLIPLREADAGLYWKWINDEETNFWRGLYHPMTHTAAIRWLKEQMNNDPTRLTVAIEIQKGRAKIKVGFMGLRSICPRSRRAELWIYLGNKSYWGRGIGREAVRTLCQYGFDEMNLFRIWLECDGEHKSAVRCYQGVGFKIEGQLRKAYFRRGKFRDTCIMGLLKGELTEESNSV